MANIANENTLSNQIFENDVLSIIFKLREINSIKLTDVIRLLAHLSSHRLFKPDVFTEEMYSNIFDHLQ